MLQLIFIPVLFYFIILIFFIVGCSKISLNKINNTNNYDGISIIVCVRNGEYSITKILNDLKNQIYKGNLEFIIVDDESTDNTKEIILKYINTDNRFKYFSTSNYKSSQKYKKRAIALGIENSTFEWLLFTDVDCRLNKKWAASMSDYFSCDYVIGYSNIIEKMQIVSKFQSIDFRMLMISSCSSTMSGYPLASSGQNQAYRKSLFKSVNGFEKIKNLIQGDDSIFLQICNKAKNIKVDFALNSYSFVNAKVHTSWKNFFIQRIRWAGDANIMWKYNFNFYLIILTTFLANLLTFILLIINLFSNYFTIQLIIVLFVKLILELILYLYGSKKLNLGINLFSFSFWFLIQMPYIIISGVLSFFLKYFTWQGRTIIQ